MISCARKLFVALMLPVLCALFSFEASAQVENRKIGKPTKEEMEMVRAAKLNNPDIVAETSCNYLWFSNEDYSRLGSRVKCNPSVKTTADREALRRGLAEGIIDTIGSDHAPHLLSEKDAKYGKAPSGLPTIQQSLPVLLTIAAQ